VKEVFAFRHVAHEHLGSIADCLARRAVPFRYIDLPQSDSLPVDLDQSLGLIFMGGPMSANDPFPYVRRELYLISQALRSGLPMMGVCLGSQLIAKAAGSPVYRNSAKEIGWYPVYPTPEAASDPLTACLAPSETVFHWHGETFDLPAGAVWLARSELCAHQAFRLGDRVYGFQFHFEVTAEMIAEWRRQDEACGEAREVTGPIDLHGNGERMAEICERIVDGWIGLL
jgi:GMP synthase (glutamine-hydrolysing)